MFCRGWEYDVHPPTSPGSSTKRSCPTVTVSSSFASNFTIVPDVGAFTETSIWSLNEGVRRRHGLNWSSWTLSVSIVAISSSAVTVSSNLFWPRFECPFGDGLCHLWYLDGVGLNKVWRLKACVDIYIEKIPIKRREEWNCASLAWFLNRRFQIFLLYALPWYAHSRVEALWRCLARRMPRLRATAMTCFDNIT